MVFRNLISGHIVDLEEIRSFEEGYFLFECDGSVSEFGTCFYDASLQGYLLGKLSMTSVAYIMTQSLKNMSRLVAGLFVG